jgi:AcrR family transcriptional regulator
VTSRIRLLNSAERVVIRDGVAHLTLDAVAADAGMSKGGVLYHFRSKDDLIRGMVDRLIEEFEAEMERHVEADPEPAGRFMRAYLRSSFPEPSEEFARHNQVAAALLAAIVNNPALLDPICERFKVHQERLLADGLDPVRVNLIRLAADGLWMADVLHIPGPEIGMRGAVIRTLFEMTRN